MPYSSGKKTKDGTKDGHQSTCPVRLLRHRAEIGSLTMAIRRLIEVMKAEDLLSEDLKAEYKWLVREKERLRALCDKLELDVERRRKRVLDMGLIGLALQDFARLVDLLPLADQPELFHLLLRATRGGDLAPRPDRRGAAGRAGHADNKNPHAVPLGAEQSLPAPRDPTR